MKGVPEGFKWPSKSERAEREARILALRAEGMLLKEIAPLVGLSVPRVSTIYARAVAKKLFGA
jgi:DNA-directed RNA polymerase specialized sigma subunit